MATRQAGTGPSDEQIWANALPLVLGGVTKHVRPLAANPSKRWKELLAERFRETFGSFETRGNDWAQVLGLVAGFTDLQIELLVAYDHEGRLGGPEWIGDNASELEIYEAFKAVTVAAFPFLADAQRFPQLLGTLLPQLLAICGSSPSPAGDAAETS